MWKLNCNVMWGTEILESTKSGGSDDKFVCWGTGKNKRFFFCLGLSSLDLGLFVKNEEEFHNSPE